MPENPTLGVVDRLRSLHSFTSAALGHGLSKILAEPASILSGHTESYCRSYEQKILNGMAVGLATIFVDTPEP